MILCWILTKISFATSRNRTQKMGKFFSKYPPTTELPSWASPAKYVKSKKILLMREKRVRRDLASRVVSERGIFSLLFWVPFFIEIKRCPLWNIKFCHWRCFRQQTRMHVHWRSSKVSYRRCLVWFTTFYLYSTRLQMVEALRGDCCCIVIKLG